MVKRNRRNGKRRRTGTSVFAYTVCGSSGAGTINIRAGQLDLDYTRPARPLSLTLTFAANSGPSTYMVPVKLPTVVVSLISALGDVVAFSRPILVPFGSEKSVSVRAPRNTDFGQYSASPSTGYVIAINTLSRDQNTILSYSGYISILYRKFKLGISLGLKVADLPQALQKLYITDEATEEDQSSAGSSMVVLDRAS